MRRAGLTSSQARSKSFFDFWCETAFDFNGPWAAAGRCEKKVNLGTRRGPIEIALRSGWSRGNERFDDKSFPARARYLACSSA